MVDCKLKILFKPQIFCASALILLFFMSSCNNKKHSETDKFDIKTDLLLAQFDCKTDVDDLQTVAALATLLSAPEYHNLRYHAVAGAYGIQEGLYVPPNDLFQLAFGSNWTDAHDNIPDAIEQVIVIIKSTLNKNGDIWIAEAGQSDFSAQLIKAIRQEMPDVNTVERIHLIQHSDWNEQSTSPENLEFVKKYSDYHKIPDGNTAGNGTPGFRDPDYVLHVNNFNSPEIAEIWQMTIDLCNKYNGQEGRYDNEAISAGGLDFSDLSETCWILGLQNMKDVEEFIKTFCL